MHIGTKIGLVGLSAMGRGAAANPLAKGYGVEGYDLNPTALEWLATQGGTRPPRSRNWLNRFAW